MENKDSNWLASYGLLILSSAPVILSLLIAVVSANTMNPIRWNPQFTFLVMYFSAIFGFSVLNHMSSIGKINLNGFYNALCKHHFDENEFKDTKTLDVFFKHYTNVATIGLFFCLSIYTYRTTEVDHPVLKFILLGLFVLVLIVAIIFYALCLLKLVNRFLALKSYFLYVAVILGAFFVDSKVFELMISGIPKK